MSFKDYHFKQYVQQALEEIGFVNPTEVQKRLIPIVNSGRDLVGESKTGSGKPTPFCCPFLKNLMKLKQKCKSLLQHLAVN